MYHLSRRLPPADPAAAVSRVIETKRLGDVVIATQRETGGPVLQQVARSRATPGHRYLGAHRLHACALRLAGTRQKVCEHNVIPNETSDDESWVRSGRTRGRPV